jgi:hypothetical protein
MLDNLFLEMRSRWFYKNLRKKIAQHRYERKAVNLTKVNDIGIIFDATDSSLSEIVLRYAQNLKEKGRKVMLLGYFDDQLPHETVSFSYFNQKDKTWWLAPIKKAVVNEFMQQHFDLLMALYPGNQPQIEYITGLSKARFKASPLTAETDGADLMVDMKNPKDLQGLIKQIEFYLGKVNPI